MLRFYHCNHSVTDIDRSRAFYEKEFGLKVMREVNAYGGDLRLMFLGDGITDFRLELTWYKSHPQPFELGDKEFHVAFYTDDFDATLAKHQGDGIVVKEELEHRLYYIEDPDGYQVEIVEMPSE